MVTLGRAASVQDGDVRTQLGMFHRCLRGSIS